MRGELLPREENLPILPVSHEFLEKIFSKQIPRKNLKFLDSESKRRYYHAGLELGASIANTYLDNLSPEAKEKIHQIYISPFTGVFKDDGMIISFRRDGRR